MALMGGRPVPVRRKDLPPVDTSTKTDLVNSFIGFNTTTVTDEHVRLARRCIKHMGLSQRSARYEHIPFHMIVQWNQDKPNHCGMIAQACDLLLKYVVNLLKPKRPQVWRSIKTTNSHFCARVDCMVGARDILRIIGYSETHTETAMQFPDNVKEPDKEKLHVVAAELLMAKLEAEILQESSNTAGQSSMSRQSSNSTTSSTNSGPQPVSPQQTHRSPQNSHLVPPSPHSAAADEEEVKLYTEVSMNGSPTHSHGLAPVVRQASIPTTTSSLYSLHHSSPHTVSPTKAFTPVPVPHSYETVHPTKPQSGPQHPAPTHDEKISPGSGCSSPDSSDFVTPPSTSPNTTSTVSAANVPLSGSVHAAALSSDLKKLRMEREKISSQLKRGTTTSQVAGSTHTPTQRNQPVMISTEVHGTAPTVEELRASSSAVKGKRKPFNLAPAIEEEPRSLETKPSSEPPPASNYSPPKPQPSSQGTCSNCGQIVNSEQTQCSFCHHPVTNRHPTSSILPPPILTENSLVRMNSEEPRPKPLRASVASAEEAMQRHRMTHVFPPERHPDSGGTAAGDSVAGPSGGGGVVGGASSEGGGVMGGASSGGGGVMGGASVMDGSSGSGGVMGGASGGIMSGSGAGATGGAVGGNEKTYRDMHEEKLQVWKKVWKERGYDDDEIPLEPGCQPLPEYKTHVKQKPTKPMSALKTKKKIKDYDPSKNTTEELERYQREEERKKEMDKMEKEGEGLMKCVKFCVQQSYSLEEVELAYNKCQEGDKEKGVLKYLKQDWAGSVREVQQYVVQLVGREGQKVGCPSQLEARKYLVLNKGDVIKASHSIFYHRKKKIEELQQKCKRYCELEWKAAEQALSAFDMDLEKAACSIQCEMLQPLYEFIFSEWTQVPATDMKNIKKRLKGGEDGSGREANLRMLMGEFKLETTDKAVMVLELMKKVEVDDDSDYPLSYYIDAAKDYRTLEEAEKGLIKECPICEVELPVHETITMPGCTDFMCKDCFKGHFKVVITEKGVKHFNCPACNQPDMTNRDDAQDLYQELFVQLIHEHLREQYDLVQSKLTERNLQKDPGFRWCANDTCGSCFLNPNLDRKKIQCPTCNGLMCFQCKKPWEEQHNGLSCEDFAEWKRQNDPKFQREGLAAHLQANGIECPDCHMRYELARGGCMHFKCTRCPNEFCSGCGGSFKKAQVCGRFQSCANRGLHAHHPRDCLYFMRDFSVEALQDFLRENNVDFETDPAPEQLEAAREGAEEEGEAAEEEEEAEAKAEGNKVELKCSAMLQKELVDKLVDEACGDDVKDGHAGLCEKHYKEYLVDRINKAKLDPLPMYEDITIILKREEKPVPEKEDEETDEHYRERLIEHVKQELPLQRGRPDVAAAPVQDQLEEPPAVAAGEN